MPADLVIANHLRLAAGDLSDARILLGVGSRNAAYHAEQAAEKIIKAVLVSEGCATGREHRLDELVGMIPAENLLRAKLARLVPLSPYATAFRYPRTEGRLPHSPSAAELTRQLSDIQDALDAAVRVFGVSLSAEETVAAADPTPVRVARAPSPLAPRRRGLE